MYYLITSTLEKTEKLNFSKKNSRYVAVLTSAEWLENKDKFDMGIEMDMDLAAIHSTKAEVNFDSLTGTFSIPDRKHITAPNTKFAFALDEKGIVFIDDSGFVQKVIGNIIAAKRWTVPSLERFLYDFLEQIVSQDQLLLEKLDKEMDEIESGILEGEVRDPSQRVSRIRSDLRDMRNHYEQLLDLSQELEENENNFFKMENTRYFHLFSLRVSRLHDLTNHRAAIPFSVSRAAGVFQHAGGSSFTEPAEMRFRYPRKQSHRLRYRDAGCSCRSRLPALSHSLQAQPLPLFDPPCSPDKQLFFRKSHSD